MKHTPAPWIFPSKYATHIVDSSNRMIIDVPQPNWMSDEEHQANKSMVFAAPDLLEALEKLANEFYPSTMAQVIALGKANDAIAKAKKITN